MKAKLEVIKPHTLSLVFSPANKKKFYVMKEEKMSDIDFAETFPLEEKYEEAFKADVSGEAAKVIKSALSNLSKWMDDLPVEVTKAVGVLAKAVDYGEPHEDEKTIDLPEDFFDKFDKLVSSIEESENKEEVSLDDLIKALAKKMDVSSDKIMAALKELLPDDKKGEEEDPEEGDPEEEDPEEEDPEEEDPEEEDPEEDPKPVQSNLMAGLSKSLGVSEDKLKSGLKSVMEDNGGDADGLEIDDELGEKIVGSVKNAIQSTIEEV